jgi:ribose transport system permease protein
MTTSITMPQTSSRSKTLLTRHGWLAGVVVLLAIMVLWRATQVKNFGGFEVRTISAGSLSLALLAMSLAVVVISGGFNLAVGSVMVLANCFSAWMMDGRSTAACILIGILTVALAAVLSAGMGWLSVWSGVPDVIVTLAMTFALPGVALAILGGPGGGTAEGFSKLLTGGFSQPLPSIILLAVSIGLIWLPLARSRSGLAVYAVGSSKPAAFLAGVSVMKARVTAYLFSGIFAGLAGVVTTGFTASGDPRMSIGLGALLSAVAAVVLGGVALTGGTGGLVGPALAAFALGLIPALMLGLGLDPNLAEVIRGIIIIAVVMFGGFLMWKRRRI